MDDDAIDQPNLPGFPQIPALRDDERMRAVFQRHLQPANGGRLDVASCELTYIRNREGTRCMLEYDLRLVEPATGRTWNQAVTGVLYANGRTRRAWQEARATAERRPTVPPPAAAVAPTATATLLNASSETPVGATPPPFAYDADLDLLIQVFPYDHRLPALAPLLAGPLPALTPALLAAFGPGDWRLAGWAAESLRYRVDKRATVRLTVRARDAASGREAERRFYAKVYRAAGEGREAWESMRSLQSAAAASNGAFAVAAPIAFDEDLRILVQYEVPGVSLGHYLWEAPGDEGTLPAIRRSARALAAFHASPAVAPRRRSLDVDVGRLGGSRDLLGALYPEAATEIAAVAAAVIDRFSALGPGDAPTHGDLKPLHLVQDGDRVGLIDFDKFTFGDPIFDVVNILHHLAKPSPHNTLSPDQRQEASAAWLDAYFAHAPAAGRDRLPVHHAVALLNKAAAHSRRAREGPDAATDIGAILRDVRAALGGDVV